MQPDRAEFRPVEGGGQQAKALAQAAPVLRISRRADQHIQYEEHEGVREKEPVQKKDECLLQGPCSLIIRRALGR